MITSRHFALAAMLAVALVALCFLVVATITIGEPAHAHAQVEQHLAIVSKSEDDTENQSAYQAQILAMRDLHQRALSATTPQTREAVASDAGPVMRSGVNMMLRMKSALPAPILDSGVMTPKPITQRDAKLVQDFLQLMELLIEMKADTDAILHPGVREPAAPRDPERRPAPESQLVNFGGGGIYSGLLMA